MERSNSVQLVSESEEEREEAFRRNSHHYQPTYSSSSEEEPAQYEHGVGRFVLRARPRQRCRFCRNNASDMQNNKNERGYKVCQCDEEFGYAHRVCFYKYMGTDQCRSTCPHCKSPWSVHETEVTPFLKRKSRIRFWRSIHFLASMVIALGGISAAILLFAYMIKLFVYMITGSPEYDVLGWPVSTVPSPGDLITGGSVTAILLLAYAMHRLLERCIPSYRYCCHSHHPMETEMEMRLLTPPATKPRSNHFRDEEEITLEVSLPDDASLDEMTNREFKKRQKKNGKKKPPLPPPKRTSNMDFTVNLNDLDLEEGKK